MDQATAQTYLDTWLAASVGLAQNSSYTVSFPNGTSRTVTRQDIGTVQSQITYWHRVVNAYAANAAGSGSPGVTNPSWS